MEEQREAVHSRIAQLQAADVPTALQGLLQQAQTLLKPPSRSAAAAAAPAASRQALVLGLLLLLERASELAKQQRDLKLVKDAHAQLLGAFQRHDWLWQLLLRKHLPSLLQHPAAAQLFVEALSCLPGATQARAYRLWRQQLADSPQAAAVPPQLQQLLVGQLKRCFASRATNLAALLQGEGGDPAAEQLLDGAAAGDAAAAAAGSSAEHQLPSGVEVHVVLQEQLPHLLHLLLLVACSSSGTAAGSQQQEGGSGGQGSSNGPSLSSMQSAATAVRGLPRSTQRGPLPGAPQGSSSAAGSTGGSSSGGSSVQDSVLQHAVLLVSCLSDPDALHEMLGVQLRQAAGAHGSGGGEDGEPGPQASPAPAPAGQQQQRLSREGMASLHAAMSLIEVCLDGMLTMPALTAAVHQQLHSQGSSSAAGEEQHKAAAAELRHTAGLMLGMHRELARFCADLARPGPPVKAPPAAPLLSLPACQQLLGMLAEVQQGQEQAAAGPGPSRMELQQLQRQQQLQQRYTLAQGLPAVLLLPPQLVAQGLELVRQAVEASSASSATWQADMAAQVAAMHGACYRAIWGAKVLQSREVYQLLLSAARLRMLLHASTGGAAAPAAAAATADDEASAEAALVMQNAVENRRRRQRSSAHELPVRSGLDAVRGGAPPAAKRLKTEHGGGGSGSAVAELLQLFHPAGPEQLQEQQQEQQQPSQPGSSQQPQQPARRRITPVAVEPAQQAEQQPAARARKRITPQQVAPPAGAAGQSGQQEGVPVAAATAGEQPAQQQRVRITKAAEMTDEQREEMWAAYIADKELLAEMLGDADYQQWYDEAAHPLCRQRQRTGSLEAAWAAVLGGGSAGSLVRERLPRTLLAASGSMPWDAAAAACLRLLAALFRSVSRPGGGAAAAAEQAEQAQWQAQADALLLQAFSQQLRLAGPRAATRALHITGSGTILGAARAAQQLPAGGTLVLLAAQLLGLAQGRDFFQETNLSGQAPAAALARRQSITGDEVLSESGCLVAPPLMGAYAQLLEQLLPGAEREAAAAAAAATPGKRQVAPDILLSLAAQMLERLLRQPPPLQHMLAPGCAALLRVAAAGCDSEAALQQHAGLLWMLVRQQAAGRSGVAEVVLPRDCPSWLSAEAHRLESGSLADHPSSGHSLLLGPLPEVRQAAALRLLRLLAVQLPQGGAEAAGPHLAAQALLPAADACQTAMQLLLEESQRQQRQQQQQPSSDEADAGEEGDEDELLQPLLAGSPAAAAQVVALAAAVCDAGAAAGARVAAELDRPGTQPGQRQEALAASADAAGALVLCSQLLEPADTLLQSGCLPPAAQQQLEASCERLDGQVQAVQELACRLPPCHPLLAGVQQAMADAPALWQPAADADDGSGQSSSDSDTSGAEEEAPARPARQQRRGRKGARKGAAPAKQQQQQQQQDEQPGRRDRRGENARRRERRRRLQDVKNPAVRAMLAEDNNAGLECEDLSDLEDFIVFNPERDYGALFKRHFWQARGSDSEEEEEQEEGGEEEQQDDDAPQQQPQQRQAAAEKQPRKRRASGQRRRAAAGDAPAGGSRSQKAGGKGKGRAKR